MPSAPRHAALLAAVVALALAGCDRDRSAPELLSVTEVTPRQIEIGDRVEVLGEGLPVGEVDAARVILKGDVYRPGERPLIDQVVEIEGAKVERDRVGFEVTDAIVERFTGRGDQAEHATFRGRVEVWIPEGSTRIPVFGTIKGDIELDFVPRAPRRVVADAREQEARDAQAFLGAVLVPEPGGGATVGAVRDGGPAYAAGLRQGDVLTSFEGNHVLGPLDVVPSGRIRRAPFAARRAGEKVGGDVVLDGYRSDAARELVGSATVLGSLFLVMLVLGTRLGGALTWLVHRIDGVLGRRERQGLLGKLVSAAGRGSDDRPATGAFARSAPVLVAIGLSLTFAALPFFEQRGRTELDLAILYLMSVTSLLAMALVTGGWRVGKGALASRFWAVIDVVVVEVPAALALLAIVMLSGSLRVRDVVLAQTGAGGAASETGGWPWYWNAVKNPQLLALFFLFFATSLVEPNAPRTRARARETMRSMTFFFAGWMNVFVMCAILTTAFLGGYAIPGVAPQAQAQSAWLQAAGAGLFLVKCWAVVLVVLLMRAALPRLTPDFLVATGVRWVLPLSVAAVAIASIGMAYAWVPTVERAVSLVTLTTALALLAIVAASVASSLREHPRLRSRVNPLI